MLCFSTISNLKSRKFLEKIRTVLGEIDPKPQRFWLHQIIEGVCAKHLMATLVCRFPQGREKTMQVLLEYGLPKETVTAIMMLCKNIKAMVCSPDGNTDFFDIITGVLQGNMLTTYLFIICQN